MYRVKVQAKPRFVHGQEFVDFWSIGKHWPGREPIEREVTDEELALLQKEEATGYPIRILEYHKLDEAPAVAILSIPPVVSVATMPEFKNEAGATVSLPEVPRSIPKEVPPPWKRP